MLTNRLLTTNTVKRKSLGSLSRQSKGGSYKNERYVPVASRQQNVYYWIVSDGGLG